MIFAKSVASVIQNGIPPSPNFLHHEQLTPAHIIKFSDLTAARNPPHQNSNHNKTIDRSPSSSSISSQHSHNLSESSHTPIKRESSWDWQPAVLILSARQDKRQGLNNIIKKIIINIKVDDNLNKVDLMCN